MGRMILFASVVFGMANAALAEPFREVTVGVSVANLAEAEAWYAKLLGPDTEVVRPYPGITEFKVAPGGWFQLFEPEGEAVSKPILRFLVDDIAATQATHASVDINSGKVIEVPGLVTYSEFYDPDGNALGLYELP